MTDRVHLAGLIAGGMSEEGAGMPSEYIAERALAIADAIMTKDRRPPGRVMTTEKDVRRESELSNKGARIF